MADPRVLHGLIVNNGQVDRLSALLANGADPNGRWDNVPHLITAAQTGRLRAVKALLRAGATVDIVWGHGATPLAVAASKGHDDVVKLLIAAGAHLRGSHAQNMMLLTAVLGERLSIVKTLVASGADMDFGSANDFNRCPLHVAANYGLLPILRYLLRSGANPNRQDRLGYTPLYSASFLGKTECAHELLEAGADMLVVNMDGRTSFEACSQENHVAILEDHLAHGVLRVSRVAPAIAFKALCIASGFGKLGTVNVLLEAGVPPAKPDLGGTDSQPFSCAAEDGHVQVAKRLMAAGGDALLNERN